MSWIQFAVQRLLAFKARRFVLRTAAAWPSPVGLVALFSSLRTPIAPDNTLEPILEPFDGFCLVDAMAGSDLGSGSPPLCDSLARSRPDTVPVISKVLLEGSIKQLQARGLTCSSKSPCRRYQWRDRI